MGSLAIYGVVLPTYAGMSVPILTKGELTSENGVVGIVNEGDVVEIPYVKMLPLDEALKLQSRPAVLAQLKTRNHIKRLLVDDVMIMILESEIMALYVVLQCF